MLKALGGIALTIACFFSGTALIEVGITESQSFGEAAFSIICGLIMILGSLALFSVFAPSFKVLKKLKGGEETIGEVAGPSENETERLIEKFRQDYEASFRPDCAEENSPIQNSSSQVFWNMTRLQKRRLKELGLSMNFKSQRMIYGKYPVRVKNSDDGKYQIREVTEDLSAETELYCGETRVYRRMNQDIAHYTVTEARQKKGNLFCCPNCGAESTKSNLIDGCDYCGTKFSVEDLGARVNGFGLRKNYEIEYERYKAMRRKFTFKVSVMIGVISLGISLIMTIGAFISDPTLRENGYFLNAAAGILTFLIAGGFIGFLGATFLAATVFPWIQLGATATHVTKKTLQNIKQSEYKDNGSEQKVKVYDPLFSIASFYSGIQNKMASVIYASTKEQINAFSENDLSSNLSRFHSVADIDTENIVLDSYHVESGLQKASVKAELKLVVFNGGKCKDVRCKVRLKLIKSAECKTQEICEPSVLRCKGCGSSIALLDGRSCRYCGRGLDLKQLDWVINEFVVE